MTTLPKIPDIAKQVESNKTNISTKLDKGSFTGTASDLIPKEGGVSVTRGLVTSNSDGFKYKVSDDPTSADARITSNPNTKQLMIRYGGSDNTYIYNGFAIVGVGDSVKFKVADNGTCYAHGDKELFSTYNCPISKSANGYCKLANEMIIQWGEAIISDIGSNALKSSITVTFPISFASQHYSISAIGYGNSGALNMAFWSSTQSKVTIGDFTIASISDLVLRKTRIGDLTIPLIVKWIAIGY